MPAYHPIIKINRRPIHTSIRSHHRNTCKRNHKKPHKHRPAKNRYTKNNSQNKQLKKIYPTTTSLPILPKITKFTTVNQLHIQAAPHIKKYIDNTMGSPVQLHQRSTLHAALYAAIFHSTQLQLFTQKPPKPLPCTIIIQAPADKSINLKNHQAKARIIANFFENYFLENLHTYIASQPIKINRRPGPHNIKYQLAAFCQQHKIIIEEDITEEALIKMFYRYRKWLKTSHAV